MGNRSINRFELRNWLQKKCRGETVGVENIVEMANSFLMTAKVDESTLRSKLAYAFSRGFQPLQVAAVMHKFSRVQEETLEFLLEAEEMIIQPCPNQLDIVVVNCRQVMKVVLDILAGAKLIKMSLSTGKENIEVTDLGRLYLYFREPVNGR